MDYIDLPHGSKAQDEQTQKGAGAKKEQGNPKKVD